MKKNPLFSIVSVCYNDAWSLIKTARSVFEQDFDDFEYIIVDGGAGDGTESLIKFWQEQGLATRAVSEKDTGVYNAMNKGLDMAQGQFVLFLNASDVFANNSVLSTVHAALAQERPEGELDGILGWGQLNDMIWASWIESDAFKMSSLGFCHQSLFARRELLLAERFDERKFKTDSDTLQLGRLFAKGARIAILPEVLAVRGGEPGISADLERTQISIRDTLMQEYPILSSEDADRIIGFRRKCDSLDDITALIEGGDRRLRLHLAYMVLDTLFQRQAKALSEDQNDRLMTQALEVLAKDDPDGAERAVSQLRVCQSHRSAFLQDRKTARTDLDRAVAKFEREEESRITKLRAAVNVGGRSNNMVVSLTSFPARLKTVHFAIRSLYEQTCPPQEIHLWLGRDEIPGKKWLPGRLRALEDMGLQIHFADRTFHQYDKFLHNADLNADRPFVIVDDDVIYPPHALETIWEEHQKHPDVVVANRCHLMQTDPAGGLAPYSSWQREERLPGPSHMLMPTGAGGVLYPAGFMMHPAVTDKDLILEHAPYADDIWLKFCAMAQGIPALATRLSHKSDWYHRYTPTMQEGTLMNSNVTRGLNDVQVGQCINWLEKIDPDWQARLLQSEAVA